MEQINNSIIFYVHYMAGKIGKIGLTPTISIWKVTETGVSSKIVTAAAVTEVGGGYYFYKLTNTLVDSIGEYLGLFTTTDLTVNQQDIPTCISVGRGGIEYLDAPISTRALTTDLAAVKAKTDNLPVNPAAIGSPMTLANDSITAAAVTAGGANKIADHIWDDTFVAHAVAGSMGAVMNKMNVASATGDWTADEKIAIKAILGVPVSGTTPVIPTVGILDAIKDKTDTITLVPPIPDPINANITHVNGVLVTGSGVPGTDAWRPA